MLKNTKANKRFQTIFLIFALVTLMVAYMYFLSTAVVDVVVAREYSRSTDRVTSDITELEAKYITRQHTIRQEVALQDGFVAVADKMFVAPFNSSLVAGHENQ